MEEDSSGLTFQPWTPDVDTSRPPVSMMINSSELRVGGFKFKEVLEVLPPTLETDGFKFKEVLEVLPPTLETDTGGVLPTRGSGLRSLEGMDPKRGLH